MRADRAIKAMLDREGISTIKASQAMGKSRGYLSSVVSQGVVPKADSMAAICEALGYELIVRNKEDGFEISIDPPE